MRSDIKQVASIAIPAIFAFGIGYFLNSKYAGVTGVRDMKWEEQESFDKSITGRRNFTDYCIGELKPGTDSSLYVKLEVKITSESFDQMHTGLLAINNIDFSDADCFDANEDNDAYEMTTYMLVGKTATKLPFIAATSAREDLKFTTTITAYTAAGKKLDGYEKEKKASAYSIVKNIGELNIDRHATDTTGGAITMR